ncbi:MAG: hypothetical protein HRT71_10675 [Flavobacteriales bacterium]|nr:hypothetical protein [Flavobacteriales bacterium]
MKSDRAGEDAAYDKLIKDLPKMGPAIYNRTTEWLSGPVMHRFWRLTSKIGLDFFAAKPKTPVDFVRDTKATTKKQVLNE